MKWALITPEGIVHNIIDYDPSEPHGPYVPDEPLTLEEVNDWIEIGDMKDAPQTLR